MCLPERERRFFNREWSDAEKWFIGLVVTFLIAALIGAYSYFLLHPSIKRSVPFKAMSGDAVAVTSQINGVAEIHGQSIRVHITAASFTLHHDEAREVVDLHVALAIPYRKGRVNAVRTSERREMQINLHNGDTAKVANLNMVIPTKGLSSIIGYYLVFEIGERMLSDGSESVTYARTRPDLF